jgi:DNA-directed RNA polymerases I, II, and III subunit RPABC1
MSEVTKDSITISNLYKSRKILLEQLQSRGFNTSEYVDFSISEIYILYKNDQLNMHLTDSKGSSVFVKYNITKNLNNAVINEDIEFLYNAEKKLKPSDQLIYIIKGEPNDTMMNVLKEVYIQQSIFITIYNLERLLFNILEHTMVPKHNILSESQKQEVMKEYNIKYDREFPEISRFDPVAIAIGLRPRQVCEILRPSKTTIYTKYYRICVQ